MQAVDVTANIEDINLVVVKGSPFAAVEDGNRLDSFGKELVAIESRHEDCSRDHHGALLPHDVPQQCVLLPRNLHHPLKHVSSKKPLL